MKTKSIKQAVLLKAEPHDVYEALMDSEKHSELTGSGAQISRKVGGKFTAWGGYIDGVNLELVRDQKIVQSWRSSDWPEKHYSHVTFFLEKAKNGTKLTFTQTGVPDLFYDSIKQGWTDYYWKPMKETL
ncbi:MAG TPA: SRPBCC family protein [Patescibacteria group bacterium]|nr:SRPBCC family protein [Patescibacteria group bacterium]